MTRPMVAAPMAQRWTPKAAIGLPNTKANTFGENAKASETGVLARLQESFEKLSKPAQASEEKLNQEEVMIAFKKAVVIEPVKNSKMVKVKVDNASPVLAARIASVAQSLVWLVPAGHAIARSRPQLRRNERAYTCRACRRCAVSQLCPC